ncbi:ATP-binding protein [Streptomyces sp. NPDC050256]|uniref:ATP-binding protein n=1 Tax=Streptomyces sp. NPDC050256 TaxID=3365607 RepID=UPI0037A8C00E
MNQALPQPTQPARTFSQLLSSTPRGARLARLLTVTELQSWDAPPDLTERAELVVSELAANAVLHGRVAGRDFRLALAYTPPTEHLRIEVTDARGDRRPELPPYEPAPIGDGGRGLLLVAALADHWDCVPYPPSGKTVRAQLSTAWSSPTPQSLMESADAVKSEERSGVRDQQLVASRQRPARMETTKPLSASRVMNRPEPSGVFR